MNPRLPLAAALLCLCTSATAATADVTALHRLLDEDWERQLREDPVTASQLGDHRYDDRWPEVSPAAQQRHADENETVLARLARIHRERLPVGEQLNYDLFRQQHEDVRQAHRYRNELLPLDHIYGLQSVQDVAESLRFDTVADYRNWIARLRGLPRYAEDTTALMREGIAQHRVQPRVIMQKVPAQIDRHIVERPEDSPFYAPFERMPASIDAAQQAALKREAAAAISEAVIPAYRRFKTFFESEYLPASRDSVGLSALPDGAADYAFLARYHTTTELTPAQIHQIGLDEVNRIRAAMDAVRAQIGYTGTAEAFAQFLRTDPQFYFTDAEALLTASAALAKRIDGELPRLFGKLPRLPYGVRAVPADSAPYQTTAYYQPGAVDGSRAGYYYVNTYKLETRPKWEMEALTAHEAVPGHHLQIALGQELQDLPKFRTQGYGYTAFHEGWGLYAESLGDQLGLYKDPYSRYGQLSYEMWRACRLVMDTGLHAMGWTRDQAIEFMAANTPRTRHDIEIETDRYIAWPGQALAYKIGQMKITELRERARTQLGERFDIRAFHDVVIGAGDLPLWALDRRVNTWIAQSRH